MNNLKYLRNLSNLSLRQLAEYADITHATLQLLETGKRKFNEIHILKLCYFFDVTSEFLLGYSSSGIGVYFESSDNDEDHEFITLDEFNELSRKYKISEVILQNGVESNFRFIMPNDVRNSYTGKNIIFRSVEAHKEDTDTLKSRKIKKVSTFKERLKEAMYNANLTQIEVSRMSEISKSLINKYLKGVSEAGNDKLNSLARVLNVSPIWLMGYDLENDNSSIETRNELDGLISQIIEICSNADEETLKTILRIIQALRKQEISK